MSFLNNLAKGFVRSAVNQVGRDGGKVVSNKLYGDSHSTPIRGTGNGNNTNEFINNYNEIPEENSRGALITAGYQADIFKTGFWENFFALIGSFILPYVGAIYWLLIGVRNIFKKKTEFYGYEKKSVYKADKRYKSGARHDGYKNVKVFSEKPVLASKSERIIYIIKGSFALLFAYLIFTFWYGIFENWDSSESMNIEIIESSNIGISKSFIDLKKEPTENAETLKTIFSKDTIQLLNESKINSDSTKIWYKVKYKDIEGWSFNPINKKEEK